ncbi:mediator of DNA damage checkpoint protein 1 isoform X1 [Aedes albopictus]|uniref:PAX-interacting protein 1 n=1 Tax=Aedes albopictus TaxID=7160 RepID=A0ABM1YC72_AEDAL
MDDPACHMYLIAGDDRHLLREGITLIGSADNDRYSCIRLSDKSICGKHAALRWSPATLDLHVMDLCSHGGTQLTGGLDQSTTTQEISPLEWHRAASDGAIVFGSFKARFESSATRTRKRSMSFFDDSADIVDCSLEEAPQTKSRTEPKKIVQSISIPSASASQIKDTSFMIPATQPADTSTTTPNVSIRQPANDSHTVAGGGPANTTEDDDDYMFFIPETQEQVQTSVAEESQIIEPIIGRTTAKEDDDFLRFETMDDENTGDGMFNNPYVEQSQNLLHNLDESYKRDMAGADQRKSILPDRSVDSISFHGKLPAETTDDELSKIEWNETKNTDQEQEQEREGSVTPELDFDKPVARGSDVRNPMLDTLLTEEPRVESVTPDLEFDRITPQQKEVSGNASKLSLMKCVISPTADLEKEPKGQEQSITPDMDFEEQPPEEAEISLNQEGANDPYDLATQPILVDKFEPAATFKAPSSSPYDLPTQKMPEEEIRAARPLKKLTVGLINLKSSMKDVSIRANKQIELDPFDLVTQPLPKNDQADIYDLQTQHLPHSADDTVPFDLPPPSTSKVKRKSSTARPPPRKSLGQPDPFEIATQPLPVEDPNALYDLQTQVLSENDQNDTIPLDIPALPTTDDAYDLQTQPLIGQNSASSVVGDDADDAEITQNFRPKVNSTYRQSLLVKQLDPIAEDREKDKDDADISPSSNKENREDANPPRDQSKLAAVRLKSRSLTHSDNSKSHLDGDEELDEEYCLAATLPMGDGSSKDSSASASAKASGSKRSKRSDRKQDKKPVFKKPDTSAASSTKSSLPSGFETPRSRQSSTSGTVDTDTFDFNTPEHPFLDVVKKEKILAISDMIMSRPSRAESLAKRNKYIFGDSSDEDEDPTAPVFQKEDSKIRVMKYDKDDNGTREEKPVPVASAAPERRSNRSKKKNSRYSDDEEEKPKTKIKTIKESPPVVPPKPVKKVDESVDYEPPANKKTRKRKAAEETPAPVVELPPPPPPAIKASSKSKKAGPSASSAEIEEKPVVAPKRSKKPVVESKKPPVVEVSSEDEHTNASGTDSSSSGTRKSSRASKPRLMFTKMSPEPYRRMITRAGGLIVDLPELASVLVSDRVYRTYKFLCAIAKGIPIVGEAYLEATKTHRDFVDPWDYILQDHEMERRFKFNLKKSLSLAREAKIFQDYSVIVTPSTKPPPEEVQLIVSSAGGRVIKFPAQQPKHAEKLFAVSDLQDKDLWPRFRERYPTIEIISTEGFMLSIMQHYKNFRSYRLT